MKTDSRFSFFKKDKLPIVLSVFDYALLTSLCGVQRSPACMIKGRIGPNAEDRSKACNALPQEVAWFRDVLPVTR